MGGDNPSGVIATVVVIGLLLLAGISVAVVLKARANRQKRRIGAMSAEERAHHDAVLEYKADVLTAENLMQVEQKSRESRLRAAQKQLNKASAIGQNQLGLVWGKEGMVTLRQHEIKVPHGTYALDENVRATVDTAGNLATSRRATLTRMTAGGLLGGPIGILAGGLLTKGKVHDTRELYLMVEGSDFATLLTCKPDSGSRVRQFAANVNQAARQSQSLRVQRAAAIRQANADLENEKDNIGSLSSAEARLAEVRANTAKVDDALSRVQASRPLPNYGSGVPDDGS
jgi:hypothetical protein